MTIYAELLAAGVPIDSHESDLYAKVTPESRAIVAAYEHRSIVTTFTHQGTGGLWYDIPFAFIPFWEREGRPMNAPCLICGEEHEPRELSFDGKGINGCGMYRTRLATFTSGATDDNVRDLGPLFAAAPALLAALEAVMGGQMGAGYDPNAQRFHDARAAILAAKGEA